MVPPIQFILRVVDVLVVQSIPQVQCWSCCSSLTVVDVPVVLVIGMVVHVLGGTQAWGYGGGGL